MRQASHAVSADRSWLGRVWDAASRWTRAFARHPDPLVEASNWVAILIGTHLPFWPLYVRWSAGPQAFPTAWWTMSLAPLFLVIPPIARRSGSWGRVLMPVAGIANTVFTIWILGSDSGTILFLAPCTLLAAISFRRSERWLMLVLTILPLAVFYGLRHVPLKSLHHYDPEAAKQLFNLNVISVSVLAAAIGWLQGDVYRRMEKRSVASESNIASPSSALIEHSSGLCE